MTQEKSPKFSFRLPPQGLMMQLIAIVLLPLLAILLAITFGSISAHQKAMRMMIGERDGRTVVAAAKALDAQIEYRLKELNDLALTLSPAGIDLNQLELRKLDTLREDFDAGIGMYDAQGTLVGTQGNSRLWDAISSNPSAWQDIFAELHDQPGKLVVITSPVDQSFVGLVLSKANDELIIVGAYSITPQLGGVLADVLPTGGDLMVLVVDQAGHILYKSGEINNPSSDHPGISQALQGKSGVTYVSYNGDEHVTAYSPIASAGWALLTEESWEALSTPTLTTTQVAPLVLVPALLIMLLALWLGARQVVKPLRTLESKAARLAAGDFASIEEPVKGIAEIQHLQKELVEMAHKVQEAQRSLHGYIGSITAAQEEERRRLARELHDDTLQALIALKQRVQLAQLELESNGKKAPTETAELEEIATLTENTIENLRRVTRDLRPIYLEDLGLVPALEMLARDTGQALGIPLKFHRLGTERRLDTSKELVLYRMAQEALSNISRHAQAKKASVSVSFSPVMVTLRVEDDGQGFRLPANAADYAANGHYGLLGLQERAELVGAKLDINTSPGNGTIVTVTLPV